MITTILYMGCDTCRKRIVYRTDSVRHIRQVAKERGWIREDGYDICNVCMDKREFKLEGNLEGAIQGAMEKGRKD